MAEGILRKLVEDLGDQAPPIEVQSAGTMGMVGQPASQFSVSVAAEYGIDISDHRSQAASRELLDSADLIFGLSDEHYHYVLDLGVNPEKIFLLRGFPNRDVDHDHASILDPIGMPRQAYQQVFFQIEEYTRHVLTEIVRRAREKAAGG